MLFRSVLPLFAAAGCQGTDAPKPRPAQPVIEARQQDLVIARVTPGHPCRAMVDGDELLVGGPPLLAQHGDDRWTGVEDAGNGTTLFRNDRPVARIHAKQLFDGDGIPLLRVLDNGDLADKSNAVIGHATTDAAGVTIAGAGDTITVRGTTDVELAAMLVARQAPLEVRALAACHFLLMPDRKQ